MISTNYHHMLAHIVASTTPEPSSNAKAKTVTNGSAMARVIQREIRLIKTETSSSSTDLMSCGTWSRVIIRKWSYIPSRP